MLSKLFIVYIINMWLSASHRRPPQTGIMTTPVRTYLRSFFFNFNSHSLKTSHYRLIRVSSMTAEKRVLTFSLMVIK